MCRFLWMARVTTQGSSSISPCRTWTGDSKRSVTSWQVYVFAPCSWSLLVMSWAFEISVPCSSNARTAHSYRIPSTLTFLSPTPMTHLRPRTALLTRGVSIPPRPGPTSTPALVIRPSTAHFSDLRSCEALFCAPCLRFVCLLRGRPRPFSMPWPTFPGVIAWRPTTADGLPSYAAHMGCRRGLEQETSGDL